MNRPLDYLATVRAMSRALELLDGDHFTEAEALRLAWLEQRERPEASPQLPLLAGQESRESRP